MHIEYSHKIITYNLTLRNTNLKFIYLSQIIILLIIKLIKIYILLYELYTKIWI